MRVHVSAVLSMREDCALVRIDSPYGTASVCWSGPAPIEGRTYDVEIDLPTELTWGTDIRVSVRERPAFEQLGERVLLAAQLEAIEEDGVAVLRIGDDLVLAATKGAPAHPGEQVEMALECVMVHDICL